MEMEEGSRIGDLTRRIFDAAAAGNWELIDGQYRAELAGCDGNQMAKVFLGYAGDENPNIRDAVATSLLALKITDEKVKEEALDVMMKMMKMAKGEKEAYSAGRAAVFLLENRDNEKLGRKIERALLAFKKKVSKNDWREGLLDWIPELQGFLSK